MRTKTVMSLTTIKHEESVHGVLRPCFARLGGWMNDQLAGYPTEAGPGP